MKKLHKKLSKSCTTKIHNILSYIVLNAVCATLCNFFVNKKFEKMQPEKSCTRVKIEYIYIIINKLYKYFVQLLCNFCATFVQLLCNFCATFYQFTTTN